MIEIYIFARYCRVCSGLCINPQPIRTQSRSCAEGSICGLLQIYSMMVINRYTIYLFKRNNISLLDVSSDGLITWITWLQ